MTSRLPNSQVETSTEVPELLVSPQSRQCPFLLHGHAPAPFGQIRKVRAKPAHRLDCRPAMRYSQQFFHRYAILVGPLRQPDPQQRGVTSVRSRSKQNRFARDLCSTGCSLSSMRIWCSSYRVPATSDAGTASNGASSAWLNVMFKASSDSSSCFLLRAPIRGTMYGRCARTHAIASCDAVAPCFAASDCKAFSKFWLPALGREAWEVCSEITLLRRLRSGQQTT